MNLVHKPDSSFSIEGGSGFHIPWFPNSKTDPHRRFKLLRDGYLPRRSFTPQRNQAVPLICGQSTQLSGPFVPSSSSSFSFSSSSSSCSCSERYRWLVLDFTRGTIF